jgi:hypothetical protein
MVLAMLAVGGCAGLLTQEYGEQGFRHQRFLELDSTLGMHLGDRVMLQAQEDVGQDRPSRRRPNVVTFRGDLLALSDGWVHMLRSSDDTVRIGKGNVVGVWLTGGEREQWPATLLGAAILGGAAAAIIQTQSPSDRPAVGLQVGIVAAAGLGGAFLGTALGGGERRGQRLYPAPPPSSTDTTGQR